MKAASCGQLVAPGGRPLELAVDQRPSVARTKKPSGPMSDTAPARAAARTRWVAAQARLPTIGTITLRIGEGMSASAKRVSKAATAGPPRLSRCNVPTNAFIVGLVEKACFGQPSTSRRAAWSRPRSASSALTTCTATTSASPSAMAFAISRVLPCTES